MKYSLFIFLCLFSFSADAKVEITAFSLSIINKASVTVAFENLEEQGNVTCIFKNDDKKPIGKIKGFIDGVGALTKNFPLETKVPYVSCYESN